jgi:hypothetical protein
MTGGEQNRHNGEVKACKRITQIEASYHYSHGATGSESDHERCSIHPFPARNTLGMFHNGEYCLVRFVFENAITITSPAVREDSRVFKRKGDGTVWKWMTLATYLR